VLNENLYDISKFTSQSQILCVSKRETECIPVDIVLGPKLGSEDNVCILVLRKYFLENLSKRGKVNPLAASDAKKLTPCRLISKKSDKTVDEINRNKPTNMDKTSAQNIDSDLDKYLSSFSSTILLLVVGYPDMCSHPPLVSLSLTPKPLRCDLNAEYPMTIHQKERANA